MRFLSILVLTGLVAGCADSASTKGDLVSTKGDNAMMARDDDSDGYAASDDCDDTDANINPGEAELCDSVDNDCDGDIDDDDNGVVENLWASDWDGDGYTE
ncbi:MAG: MopE-related protein, partial [Candidatus Uhrbacteria bacterium]|nr:MopE-related protein [Candidatus Uhrbacteria bacterium]